MHVLPLLVYPISFESYRRAQLRKCFTIFLNVATRNIFRISTTVLWFWVEPHKSHWVGWCFCFVLIQNYFFSEGHGRRWKKRIFHYYLKRSSEEMSPALVEKWKLHPALLRLLQPEGFTYLLSHSSPKQDAWTTFNFRKGKGNFSDWTGQRLVQFLLLQPKWTADVSFYVSKDFLSSMWADLMEPRISFKDFSLSSLTVASLREGGLS